MASVCDFTAFAGLFGERRGPGLLSSSRAHENAIVTFLPYLIVSFDEAGVLCEAKMDWGDTLQGELDETDYSHDLESACARIACRFVDEELIGRTSAALAEHLPHTQHSKSTMVCFQPLLTVRIMDLRVVGADLDWDDTLQNVVDATGQLVSLTDSAYEEAVAAASKFTAVVDVVLSPLLP